jgi:hypothetical protein
VWYISLQLLSNFGLFHRPLELVVVLLTVQSCFREVKSAFRHLSLVMLNICLIKTHLLGFCPFKSRVEALERIVTLFNRKLVRNIHRLLTALNCRFRHYRLNLVVLLRRGLFFSWWEELSRRWDRWNILEVLVLLLVCRLGWTFWVRKVLSSRLWALN